MIGIYITKRRVHVTHTRQKTDHVALSRAFSINIDNEKFREGGSAYISGEIKRGIKDFDISENEASVAISADITQVHQFSIASGHDLTSDVKAYLAKINPEDSIDSYVWDYKVCRTEDSGKKTILAVMLAREKAEELSEIVRNAGLTPKNIELVPFCQWATLSNEAKNQSGSYASIYVSDDHAYLSLFSNDDILYYRVFQCDLGDELEKSANTDQEDELLSANVKAQLENFTSEIVRSLNYAQAHNLVSGISSVYFNSDYKDDDQVPEHLKEVLKLNVVRHDPTKELKIDGELSEVLKEDKFSFSVAIGLSLNKPYFSFLPTKEQKKVKKTSYSKSKTSSVLGYAAAIVVIGVLAIPVIYSRHLKKQVQINQNTLNQINQGLNTILTVSVQQKSLEDEFTRIQNIFGESVYFVPVMKAISQTIPKRFVVEEIEYFDDIKKVTLKGVSHYLKNETESFLTKFFQDLDETKVIGNIRLKVLKKNEDTSQKYSYQYEFTGDITFDECIGKDKSKCKKRPLSERLYEKSKKLLNENKVSVITRRERKHANTR